jgi:hypothetical protein
MAGCALFNIRDTTEPSIVVEGVAVLASQADIIARMISMTELYWLVKRSVNKAGKKYPAEDKHCSKTTQEQYIPAFFVRRNTYRHPKFPRYCRLECVALAFGEKNSPYNRSACVLLM